MRTNNVYNVKWCWDNCLTFGDNFLKRILTSLLTIKLILDALMLPILNNKFKVHFILKGARAI